MFDPFNKKSFPMLKEMLSVYDFFTQVYPEQVMAGIITAVEEKRGIQPPKCIFVPEKELIRKMIKANILYGEKDSETIFLLRFGLLDNPNWHLKYKED